MKFDVVIGNPPYSDGTHGAAPIYLDFIAKSVELSNRHILLVTPNTWAGTGFVKTKQMLIDSGLHRIKHLDDNTFSSVKMSLCYFAVDKESNKRKISVVYANNESVSVNKQDGVLTDVGSLAVYEFIKRNATAERFKLKRSKTRKTSYYPSGNDYTLLRTISKKDGAVYESVCESKKVKIDTTDIDKWKIAFGEYRRNHIVIVPPGKIVPNTFYYLPYDTKKEAEQVKKYLLSAPIRWIVKNTHRTRTFCGATLKYVPCKANKPVSLNVRGLEKAIKTIGDFNPY